MFEELETDGKIQFSSSPDYGMTVDVQWETEQGDILQPPEGFWEQLMWTVFTLDQVLRPGRQNPQETDYYYFFHCDLILVFLKRTCFYNARSGVFSLQCK